MLRSGWGRVQTLGAGAALSFFLALTGCGAFFSCEGKASCGTSGTGGSGGSGTSGTGDYVFVSNSTSGSTYINGYQIGQGALTALSGFPFNLNFTPVAMAVSPNNNFLYVASASGLYLYSISSTGVLAAVNQVTQDTISSIAISHDGNYLFELGTVEGDISEYSVNQSTGALTFGATISTAGVGGGSLAACSQAPATSSGPTNPTCGIATSPANDYVAVALNAHGINVFSYSSSAGITNGAAYQIVPGFNGYEPFSVAFDSSDYLYATQNGASGSIVSTSSKSNYAATPNSVSIASTAVFPLSVALNPSYNLLYTANVDVNTIQGFSVSSGGLTNIAPSGFVGPSNVSAVGVDRSGTYVVAAGYGATDGLQLLALSASTLSKVASYPTGTTTSVPVVMALTH